MTENNQNLKILIEIPDDEDPEYYFQNMTEKYQVLVKNKIDELKNQNETIEKLTIDEENNENIKEKIKALKEKIKNNKKRTKEIRDYQKTLISNLQEFYQNTSNLNQTTHTLSYINSQLDILIKKYKKQKEENEITNTKFDQLYQQLPYKTTIKLEPYEPENLSITINQIKWRNEELIKKKN